MSGWDWGFLIAGGVLLPFAAMGVGYTVGLIRREGFKGTNRVALPAAVAAVLGCLGCIVLPLLPGSGWLWGFILRGCRGLTAFLCLLQGAFWAFAGLATRRKGAYASLLVLGCGGKDGFASRRELEGRTALAASLWRPGMTILASGGGDGEPESAVIAGQLRALGIPPAAIREESRSRNTLENMKACRTLAEQPCRLVTSGYHLPRALLLGRLAGFRGMTGSGAKSTPFLVASFFEMLACLYFFLWLPGGFFLLFLLEKLLRLLTM